MKAVNLWKTLFCAALAITTFGACSDDDKDDEGGLPSITVNGEASATVAVKLDGGTTDAIEVVSTGSWALTFDDETASAWCHPSRETGGKGKTTLTFTVDPWEGAASNAERQVTAKLLTNGSFEGIPIPKTATITIKQNGAGSTTITTNVKEIRDKLTFPNSATEITESMVVTGIVVSDVAGNNINNKSFMIADDTTEPGAGLFIRLKGTNTVAKMGNIVQFELKGGSQQSYFGTYQVNFTDATADPTITVLDSNDNTPAPIAVEDVSKLAEYQSQYVQVYSQPVADIIGQKYYNVSSGYANHTFVTRTGESFSLSFGSYTKDWASAIEIPNNSGNIKGCVSINNNLGNVSPRNADDLKGMTEPLFEIAYKTSTIANIKEAGNYQVVDAVVAANYQSGFVMEDATGQMLVYQFVSGQTITIPAVGAKVTVKGSVESRNGMLQFSPSGLEITENGTGTVKTQTATELDGAAVTALFGAPVMEYVKYTGKLTVSGNYYNVAIDGTEVIGSLSYPNADLNVSSFNGQVVDVEGWFIGATTASDGAKYLTTLVVKISQNATIASGAFETQPTLFDGTTPEAQVLKYSANAAAGTVLFAFDGGNADMFTVDKKSDTEVEINAKGTNNSGAVYTTTLQMKAADGTLLASVTLTQASAGMTKQYTEIKTVAELSEGEYLIGGYGTTAKTLHLYTSGLTSGNGFTSAYTYKESDGTLTTEASYTAVTVKLEAVPGVANAYKILDTKKNQYITATAASSGKLKLETTTDLYWILSDAGSADSVIEQDIKATQSGDIANVGLIISVTAGSNVLRSWNLAGSNKANGLVFFKKNF